MDILIQEFIANHYIQFVSQVVLLLAFFKIALKFVLNRLQHLTKNTQTKFDDIAINTLNEISNTKLVALSILIPSLSLNLPQSIVLFDKSIIVIILSTILSRGLLNVIEKLSINYLKKNPSTKTIVGAVKKLVSVTVYVLAAIIILDLYGVNINTLIAGLGIGGVAAALAVQNILADIFSAITLYIDRPFNVGDYISFGQNRGTITKIGLKSTTLKTLLGTEIIVSNKDLTSGQIENFGRMKDRTINFDLGVAYDTPVEKLDLVTELITSAVTTNEATLIHCYLTELRDFTLNFTVRYKLDTKDYVEYLTLNEKILKDILKSFAQHKIEIPFPTQNINHKSI